MNRTSITYTPAPEAALRCNAYAMQRHRIIVLMYGGISLCGGLVVGISNSASGVVTAVLLGIGAAATALIGLPALIHALLRLQIRDRYTVGRPATTTSLTPLGVVDSMPEKTNRIPWQHVQRVHEHLGDVFILRELDGCWIPREAFATQEEASEFAAAARELARSLGEKWENLTETSRATPLPGSGLALEKPVPTTAMERVQRTKSLLTGGCCVEHTL